MVPSVATEKIPSVTPPGIDPETVRLVAQCLNHYATPGPQQDITAVKRKAVGRGSIYLLEIAGTWRKKGMERREEKECPL
jgi:hypothetical protein